MAARCTCPTKFDDQTRAIVRASLDQFCPLHGQRQVDADAARAALDRDAMRYRFLRAGGGQGLYVADGGRDWRCVKGEELDRLVDQAREPS